MPAFGNASQVYGSQGLLKTNDLVGLFRTFFFRIQADRAFCRDVYGAGTASSRRIKRVQPLRRDWAYALWRNRS